MTKLAWWLLAIVVLAGAWTMHEQFGWVASDVPGRPGEFLWGWLMNTIMFEVLLGLPAVWSRWRSISHRRGAGGLGRSRGTGANAHLLLRRSGG